MPGASYRAARTREALAWLVCLAATIMAMIAWRGSSLNTRSGGNTEVTRQSLIASAPDLIRTEWTDGKTPLSAKVTVTSYGATRRKVAS